MRETEVEHEADGESKKLVHNKIYTRKLMNMQFKRPRIGENRWVTYFFQFFEF